MKMIIRQVVLGLFLLAVSSFNFLPNHLNAAEVDKGLMIIDNKPWKISWVQENDILWVLIAQFDNGTLRTFFKRPPPSKGLGLSPDNQPTKQEFEFYLGKKFTSTKSQFEQWLDGAKCYAFIYEEKFEREGRQLEFGTTAIIEEVDNAENEIRYAMFKRFN